ncbi:hypothetical protein MHUMG1_08961 [Metarhizium humberi]|uniref:Uncharacterized protein n=1 Tax=Metarhizium humberi TaxID=2596975 RepID=A0A9P8S4G3_9HYPO|nr:hypothetical protein MHUMG1_08961 [Metarhizium humberi]
MQPRKHKAVQMAHSAGASERRAIQVFSRSTSESHARSGMKLRWLAMAYIKQPAREGPGKILVLVSAPAAFFGRENRRERHQPRCVAFLFTVLEMLQSRFDESVGIYGIPSS